MIYRMTLIKNKVKIYINIDTNKFMRLKYIKEIIYDINADKNKVFFKILQDLNISEFIKIFVMPTKA